MSEPCCHSNKQQTGRPSPQLNTLSALPSGVLQDFAAVAAAHGRFLETLTTQSLFHSPSMHALMHLAFGLSHRLCALVKGASEKKCVDLEEVQVGAAAATGTA